MTTEKEIDQQLDREVQAWYNKVYDGKPLPERFIEMFKKALMYVAPANHKYNMLAIKKMISQRSDEVTMVEVGMMINLIYSTPFDKLYSTPEEGVETTMLFDEIRREYNEIGAKFEGMMMKKRETLLRLSGVTKTTPFNRGLIAEA